MRRKLISTMAMLAVAAAVFLAGVQSAHADAAVPADVTAYAVSWEGLAPGHGSSSPLFAGMDMYEAACLLDAAAGFGCGWELAFAVRDGVLCIIGLTGAGKAVMAW
ncbi:MAG: hypothetical protein OXI76_15540, partial [Gemmatimonadota bacterium]|nr:hypothetical protein [Gemmatimonadota bacterium]